MGGHSGGDGFPDLREFYFPGSEGFDRDFVGGIIDGGECAPGEASSSCKGKGRKVHGAGCGEFKLGEFGKIDGF